MKETFLDRLHTGITAPKFRRIGRQDIGAAIGEFTIFAAQQAARGKVVAFEPNPQSFSLLQENLKLNSIRNVQAVLAGVWSKLRYDDAGRRQWRTLAGSDPLLGSGSSGAARAFRCLRSTSC